MALALFLKHRITNPSLFQADLQNPLSAKTLHMPLIWGSPAGCHVLLLLWHLQKEQCEPIRVVKKGIGDNTYLQGKSIIRFVTTKSEAIVPQHTTKKRTIQLLSMTYFVVRIHTIDIH
jgi:hypothetical protein